VTAVDGLVAGDEHVGDVHGPPAACQPGPAGNHFSFTFRSVLHHGAGGVVMATSAVVLAARSV
jgi:hypothetical protein